MATRPLAQRRLEKLVDWAFVHIPLVARTWFRRRGRGAPPFVPLRLPLSRVRLGLVTTGGVHHLDQPGFLRRAEHREGDGSYRPLDLDRPRESFTITHDWYDHRDAERDLNLVLPVERLQELVAEGVLGSLEPHAMGLMGHVEGPQERRLEEETAPALAARFRSLHVDAVLLVPA